MGRKSRSRSRDRSEHKSKHKRKSRSKSRDRSERKSKHAKRKSRSRSKGRCHKDDLPRYRKDRSRSKERTDHHERERKDGYEGTKPAIHQRIKVGDILSKELYQPLVSENHLQQKNVSEPQGRTVIGPAPAAKLSKKVVHVRDGKKGINDESLVNNEKSKEKIPKVKDKKLRHPKNSKKTEQITVDTPRSKEIREKLEACFSDSALLENSDNYMDLVTHGYVSFDRLQELSPLKQMLASESEIKAAVQSSTLIEVARVNPGVKRKGNQPLPKKLRTPKRVKVESTLLSLRNQETEILYRFKGRAYQKTGLFESTILRKHVAHRRH